MSKKIFKKCVEEDAWNICRLVENNLLSESDETIIEIIKDCYDGEKNTNTACKYCSRFLNKLASKDNGRFQRILMGFVLGCEEYDWWIAQYAEKHVKRLLPGSLSEDNLLELATINLFKGSWERMQKIAVDKMIKEKLVNSLERLANMDLHPVRGQWTDTWASEHSGITHYLGLHPSTQKMAQLALKKTKPN